MPYHSPIRKQLMNVNGYEIKPYADLYGAYLQGAYLEGADLEGANVKGTILEKKEEPQDDKDIKIKELEEELKKYKDTIDALKALLND